MTRVATATSESNARMSKVMGDLKVLMTDLGLGFSAWDAGGAQIEPLAAGSAFCRLVCDANENCQNCSRDLSARAVSEGKCLFDKASTGCCVLAVPIRERRRIRGAVAACFPIRAMLRQEPLRRLCNRLKLDYETMRSVGEASVRYDEEQVPDFADIVSRLMKGEQERQVARGELTTLSTNLAATYEELSLLYRISGAMRVTKSTDDFVRNVCEELIEVMNIESAAAVLYAHPPVIDEDLVVLVGKSSLSESQVKLLEAIELGPRLAQAKRSLVDNDFAGSHKRDEWQFLKNVIAAPLTIDDEPLGLLIGMNKRDGEFDSVDLKLVSAIAEQSTVFLSNSLLYADLQDLLMGVLHALTATIDAKDPYTCGHSQRVALISRRLAEECGFESEKVRQIYLSGLLHDIGKIGVPEAILCKIGRLTDAEYDDMKRHPVIGARILGGIRQLDEVIVGILNHHERPDGKGYPCGLSGDSVPMEGLIIGLADCFDAMTSDRTYRKALPLGVAIEEIRNHVGTQFDPALVSKLLSLNLEEFMQSIHEPEQTVFPTDKQRELTL